MSRHAVKTGGFPPIRTLVNSHLSTPAKSEIRFLEYRLEVISQWPPSARKDVTSEAISRRLASIARSTLDRPGVDDLLATSCRLLEGVFSSAPQATETDTPVS
jgi:hypothetical protein